MSQPLVSIIIVNWNGLEWLKISLPSLATVTYQNLEVIVVDNGSTDGSVEYLKQCSAELFHSGSEIARSTPGVFPAGRRSLAIVRNETNLGFAEPNNQGWQRARGEFILLLNNDMRYEPNFIEPLVAACQEPGVGAAQPKMVLLQDHRRLDVVGSYLTRYGILYHFGFGQPADTKRYNQPRDLFSAKGAALMIRADVLKQTGLFDTDYFAYFEETDLCWRIWLAGWCVRYVPAALVYHHGGATSQRISAFTHFHSFKNRLATLIKNLGFARLVWMVPLHIMLMVLASLAYLASGQTFVAGAIWRALWWNIRSLPSTTRKRRHVQREIRRVSDRVLWPTITRPLPLSYFYYLFSAQLDQWPVARALEEQA